MAKIIKLSLLVNNSSEYIKGREYISDHEKPLAIVMLKGISGVCSYYK
jgi:hypothetical protein